MALGLNSIEIDIQTAVGTTNSHRHYEHQNPFPVQNLFLRTSDMPLTEVKSNLKKRKHTELHFWNIKCIKQSHTVSLHTARKSNFTSWTEVLWDDSWPRKIRKAVEGDSPAAKSQTNPSKSLTKSRSKYINTDDHERLEYEISRALGHHNVCVTGLTLRGRDSKFGCCETVELGV